MADKITTIPGTESADSITVSASNQYVQALGGRDYIIVDETNYGIQKTNVTIDAGEGNDTIRTNGYYSSFHYPAESISVNGGAGNDTIYNNGHSNTLEGGAGKDTIESSGDKTLIDGGEGNDSIVTSGKYSVTVKGGTGDDSISNTNDDADVLYKYESGDGNDVITGFNELSTLQISGGSYSTQQSGNDIIVTVGDGKITLKGAASLDELNIVGNGSSAETPTVKLPSGTSLISGTEISDSITVNASNQYVQALGGRDYITVADSYYGGTKTNITVDAGEGNDTIKTDGLYGNYGAPPESISINGGAGNDTIYNTGNSNTLEGGAGKDTIKSSGDKTLIDGGEGNDSIVTSGKYSVTVKGGTGDDSISNTNDDADVLYKYESGDGNDVITGFNELSTLQISGGTYSTQQSGNDVIVTVGDGKITLKSAASLDELNIVGGESEPVNPLQIVGTDGADSIHNTLDGATIQALGGDDTVSNSGVIVSINGGAGNDTIYNSGDRVTIDAGDGDDTVYTYYRGATIDAGAGSDLISLGSDAYSNLITYTEGDGNDTISGFNATSTLQIGDGTGIYASVVSGSDVIISVGTGSVTLSGAATLDAINIAGTYVNPSLIVGTDDADNIINTLSGATIQALGGSDTIENSGAGVSIDGGADADSIANYSGGDNVSICGGTGNDTIYNSLSESVTINSGAGNDSIRNEASNVSINAGAGNDSVYNFYHENVTIDAGKGNDIISLNGNTPYNVIIYSDGDGNDKINGFNETSTLKIGDGTGTYSTQQSGSDVIVTVGDSSITLQGAASLSTVNISGTYVNPLNIVGTAGADNITNTLKGATIQALAGNDTVNNISYLSNMGYNVSIDGGAGNDEIKNLNGHFLTINGGNGNDYIENTGDDVTVDGGAGDDHIYSWTGDNDSLKGGDGDDSVINGNDLDGSNGGENVTVNGGAGNDLISLGSHAANNVIEYSDGDGFDTIRGFNATSTLKIGDGTGTYASVVSGSDVIISVGTGSVTLSGAASLDAINIAGTYVNPSLIVGTEDADNIINTLSGATIQALGGNDSIDNTGANALFTYNAGDGNDTIIGFNETSTLQIGNGNDTYSTQQSGSDVIVIVDEGSVTLKDAAQIERLNIQGKYKNHLLIIGTAYADTLNNSLSSATVQALGGNDSVRNIGASVSVDADSGNDTVENTGYGAWNYDTHKYAVIGSPDDATILGGSGNDSLVNYGGKRVLIQGGTNDDYIANDEKPCDLPDPDDLNDEDGTIKVVIPSTVDNFDATGFDSAPDFATLDGGTGHDIIYNAGSNVSVNAGAGNDSLYNYTGDNVTLDAGDGSDTLSNGKWSGDGGLNVLLAGGKGNDSLLNSGDNATLDAGDGSDTIDNYAAQNVLIDAGAGSDSVYNGSIQSGDHVYLPDNATIIAGAGDDTITNTGDNVLFMHDDGNDLINGFNETSTLKLGDGSATYSTSVSVSDVIINTGDDSITLSGAASLDNINIIGTLPDFALNINNTINNTLIIGTKHDDTIQNSGRNVTIDALAGYDSISNSGDYVSIQGGDGDNKIANGGKYVTINTGNGDNYVELAEGSSKQTVLAQSGDDTIMILGQQAFIDTKGGDDYIVNVGTKVTINTGAGNDTVIGSQGSGATISGGDGNDFISGSGGDSIMLPLIGDDYANNLYGNNYREDYSIDGAGGNDTLTGNIGDDTLTGGTGNDILTGGDGADTFIYNLGDGKDTITDYEENDRIIVNNGTVVASSNGNNVILTVGTGRILLQGANDGRIITYTDDTGEHIYPDDPVTFSSDGKTATLLENYSATSFDINDSVYGSYSKSVVNIDASAVQQNITVTGNANANSILGSENSEYIYGGAGNDTINAGKGSDTVNGGGGDDVFVYTAGDGNLVIEDYQVRDRIRFEGVSSIKSISTLTGGTVLFRVGDGRISVKGGADRVITYSYDTITTSYPKVVSVNSAGTLVSLKSNYTDDTFDVNTSSLVSDYAGTLKTIDASAVTRDLKITANTEANKIIGGAGNDTLIGGKGNDSLTGGDGADVFVYTTGDGKDSITDYEDDDSIIVNGTVSNVKTTAKGNVVLTVGTGSSIVVADTADKVITYTDSTGTYTYPEIIELNNAGTAVTLKSAYVDDTFDVNTSSLVSDYAGTIKTIDGSAVENDIEITGNKLANKIIGGAGNDTLIGGKGNDILTGGDGDNVFVFKTGQGSNRITDYKDGDTISLSSGSASAVAWAVTGSNAILTIGTTKVTLTGGADKYVHVVDSTGGDVWYPEPPIDPIRYENKTAFLTEGYLSSRFAMSNYEGISADIRHIDATAVTHDITLVADSNRNSVIGSSQNDFINAGAANDTLTGGDGDDTFFYNAGDGNDSITDYTEGDIIMTNGNVTNITEKANGTVILYVGSNRISVAGGTSHVITYVDASGETKTYPSVIAVDGTGATLNSAYTAETFDVNTNPLVSDYATKLKVVDASAVENDIAITGNSLANNIISGAGNDYIDGGKGNDTLAGGTGNDSLKGGDGSDVFVYTLGDGSDSITDYEDDDSIFVDGKVSKVTTTAKGNVILTVGSGRIVVANAKDKVITYTDDDGTHIYPDEPVKINDEGTAVTLKSSYIAETFDVNTNDYVEDYAGTIKTIDGSAVENDIEITGNSLANNIISGAGNDFIDGGAGNDTIAGGEGNDSLKGGDGSDVFVYTLGDGSDSITDYDNDDSIIVNGEVSSVSTTAKGNVILKVGSGRIVVANAKDKVITYTDDSGIPTVYPELPVTVNAAGTAVTLKSSYTSDIFDVNTNSLVADYAGTIRTIDGAAVENDIEIIGNTRPNSILAGDGNDTLEGGKGNDTLTGGEGADEFVYAKGDGNDRITDYSEEDVIRITSGTPTFKKSGDNVIMTVGSNNVTILGAKDKIITWIDEDDEINYYPGKPVSINSAGTTATLLDIYSADTFDVATSPYIENDDYRTTIKTINASKVEHDLTIIANSLANKITGTEENDSIEGLAGKDTILGGDGNDTLVGGKGNDSLSGGSGADVFVYNTGDGNDVITDYEEEDSLYFADTTIDSMNVSVSGDDVIFTVGSGKVTVKNAADKVIAYSDESGNTSYPEVIRFSADGKSATLLAAYSKDTFNIVEDYPKHTDKVQVINASAVKHDLAIVANANKNTIVGSSSNDNIDGAAGQDVIYGGEGNDTLIGGVGNDTLYGGEGNDTFLYNKGDGNDVIADYQEDEAIRITGITGATCSNSGEDVIIKLGANTITIRNANTSENAYRPITYYDGSGAHSYTPAADGAVDLLIDDNYSKTAALSTIVEPVKADYTPYDFAGGFDLIKKPAFAPAIAYSDKK